MAGIAAVILLTSLSVEAYATSTKEQLEKAQQEKQQKEAELNQQQESISGLKQEKEGLQYNLNVLNEDLMDISDNLEELERQIEAKEEEIEETTAALNEAKATEEQQYDSMKKRIKFMYERSDYAYLEVFFTATSFADFLNKNEYIQKLSEYDRRMLDEYKATRDEIARQEAQLTSEKEELDEIKEQVEEQKKKVAGSISRTSNNIAGYANQISAAEQAAWIKEQEIKAQEASITALKKKLAEEMALSSLAANSKWRDISEVTFDDGDRYLLANLIYCEAGGEPYAGQVAVGAVVMNRVLSSVYPDTVVGVIYQNKQFSPVASGRLALALSNDRATDNCYRAADEAMKGITNVENCLYFRTPVDGVNPKYVIGGHIFY